MQTHKAVRFPIVLVSSDYWSGLLEWMKAKMIQEHNINQTDLDLFIIVDTAEEAVTHIEEYYHKFAIKPNF